jgi:DNA repair protein RadC
MPKINELPEAERPRERLAAHGANALSNAELLAILIGSGRPGGSALELATRLLAKNDEGVAYLAAASVEELCTTHGVGEATACRIAAAVALGRRIAGMDMREVKKFTSPEDIAALFMDEMRREKQEKFQVLLLNVRNEMIGKETVSVGNISSSIVDPRDVFRPAIRRGAASIVLLHNHPSGNPEPSDADVDVTTRIYEAGEVLGIKVMDHLVIGDGQFVSMRVRKLLFRKEGS